ncbi:hypothetical protein CDAR_395491 [Caerostris darwini]|uniref:Uncharacterized protein n=1 Tax=Caerostris darwini TaxID=1538125 RepID=A0AAV4M7E4_9ARAC|nr:hypothetical protein CDAR_395491 [Caerostris darwini]
MIIIGKGGIKTTEFPKCAIEASSDLQRDARPFPGGVPPVRDVRLLQRTLAGAALHHPQPHPHVSPAPRHAHCHLRHHLHHHRQSVF